MHKDKRKRSFNVGGREKTEEERVEKVGGGYGARRGGRTNVRGERNAKLGERVWRM